MHYRTFLLGIFILLLSLPAQAQFGKRLGELSDKAKTVLSGDGLSNERIGEAMKQALGQGVDQAVDQLSAKDGYLKGLYRIDLPSDAQKIVRRVSALPGFQNIEAQLIERLNRAAEDAAGKAAPIFVSAIQELTFADVKDILMGEDDAATRYLETATRADLTAAFRPVIEQSLDEVNASALWAKISGAYNGLPFVKPINTDLSGHVADSALDGMFGLIEVREEALREQPAMRNTAVLREVFARQDK